MRTKRGWTTAVALLMTATASAGAATLDGTFEVNNTLPRDAELTVTVTAEGAGETAAAVPVEVADEMIGYSVEGLAPGLYRVDLVATLGDSELVLARLDGVAVEGAEAMAPAAGAIGVDGAVSGEITLAGEPPADRLLLVRADRTDIEVEGMPDALNRLSFEVSPDEAAEGSVAYEFEGMSYGVYRVELIGYDYRTHQVEVYGALDGTLTVDAEAPRHDGVDFTVELGAASG